MSASGQKNNNVFKVVVLYNDTCSAKQRPHNSYCTYCSLHSNFAECSVRNTRVFLLAMYTYLIILAKFAGCYCYAGYDLFQGFNVDDVHHGSSTTTTSTITANTTSATTIMSLDDVNNINQTTCQEEERAENIGTFEVPTQLDIVSMMKTMLIKSFSSHYQKVLTLIKNMKQAIKASKLIQNRCAINNVPLYKKCIEQVKTQSEIVIKNLVVEAEHQKMAVSSITEEKICNLSLMKTDPLELIITLAQENISLEFALPGFLRSLSACYYYCSQ